MSLVLRVEPWESVADLDFQVIKGLQVILDFQDQKVSTGIACIWEYQTVFLQIAFLFPITLRQCNSSAHRWWFAGCLLESNANQRLLSKLTF